MVRIERAFPTWTVTVDGKARFTGLWRRSTAQHLADTQGASDG